MKLSYESPRLCKSTAVRILFGTGDPILCRRCLLRFKLFTKSLTKVELAFVVVARSFNSK